jgi:GT2 family glycosyltransferase
LLLRNRRLIDSTGHFLDFVGYTYQRGEDEVDNGQYDDGGLSDIFYAYGAAFMMPMNTLSQVLASGFLFDPDYFCYHEDADLCWRIRLLGYRIVYAPKSVVYHYKGAAGMRHGIPPYIVFHHTKNRVTSLIKNYNLTNLTKYMFPSLFIEISRAVVTLRLEPSHSIATLKAVLWVGRNLKRTWRKRGFVQNYVRRVTDKEITKHLFGPQLFYNFRKFKRYSGSFIGS